MNPARRIVIAINQAKLDIEREGEDDFMRGYIHGLKVALSIEVGQREAAKMLAAS